MRLMVEKQYSFVPPGFCVNKIVLEYIVATVSKIEGISNQSIPKSIFKFLVKDVRSNLFFLT